MLFIKEMRKFFFLFIVVFLYGCETSSERIARYSTHDDNICQSQFGLKPGSDGYANCRVNMMQLRMQEHDRVQRESEFLMNYGQYISRCGISGQYCR